MLTYSVSHRKLTACVTFLQFLEDVVLWYVREEKQWWFTSGNPQRMFPAEGKSKNKTYHCTLFDRLKPSGNSSQAAATQNSQFCRRLVLVFFVCSSQHSGIISVNYINWFACVMKVVLLFREVGTEFLFTLNSVSDVNWTCIIVITEESKNQLDAIWYFIVLLIGSTCFEHY